MTDQDYRLSDRYLSDEGSVFLTGVQALARVPIEQLRRDHAVGHRTAALVSGYPGSPLGGFDQELARALRLVGDLPIVHQPAVNEELGATAVMGSQLAAGRPDATYDGVVGIWYGKAPGLDRATDALRHGVFGGASRTGGALALVGDDPASKSSTMPSSSDAALVDLHMPILYPATVAECLELGLHGVAMSRATGLWSALKIVTPIADGSGTVMLPGLEVDPVIPTMEIDGEVWRQRPSAQFLGPRMIQVEREFHEIRLDLARRYGIENGLNRVVADPDDAWIGIVATGYTFTEVREALRRLGLGRVADIEAAGIRLLHLRLPVPFDTAQVVDFARGLDEVFVIEEKNPTLEMLIRDALYPSSLRPVVLGKTTPDGTRILPSHGRLDADAITPSLRARLVGRLGDRLAPPPEPPRELIPLSVERAPFFCSGCPHNWGTKVPEGSVVGMGTGCHGMTLLMDEDRVGESIGITAMGNEGAHWVGMAPFVETPHVFQNLGDGTYFHSAQLAVQAAIGSGTTMTFKLLYNDTVAMTGGQETTFRIGTIELAQVLLLQGAAEVVITTEDLDGYAGRSLPDGVEVRDRSEIVAVQERLAAVEGVTVLIHDQECAAEVRRARRRGRIDTPNTRVVINHLVCEGCGDCGDVSNCLSVQPHETPFGRKTRIDQASCNLDLSCLQGDCPAFMTVEVDPSTSTADRAAVEPPSLPGPPDGPRATTTVRLAGIGGTGVVTAAQVLGTAALLDGWQVDGLDQTGLSQKAGPVISDLAFVAPGDERRTNLVGGQQADVVLAFDLLVAANAGTAAAAWSSTTVVASTASTPTGRQITAPTIPTPDVDELLGRLGGADSVRVDAAAIADHLVRAPATANMVVTGAALESGVLPISLDALTHAVRLNGVAVEANLAAIAWGRAVVADPDGVATALARWAPDAAPVDVVDLSAELGSRIRALPAASRDVVGLLAADLVGYQDESYAGRFLDLVERAATTDDSVFVEMVARSHHRLMANKDEYEVARLMLLPGGQAAAAQAAGRDDPEITWHLHPPTLRRLGRESKMKFGPKSMPMFRTLAASKRLRGTRLDVFGRDDLRRLERSLPAEFAGAIEVVVSAVGSGRLGIERAREIAALPDSVRGYEDLKRRRIEAYQVALASALAEL